MASPHKTAKYVTPLDTFIDFQNRRAIIVDGHEDAIMTLTAVQDVAAVVAQAVDYEGEWPKVGGIRGNRITVSRILEIGEVVRGTSTIYTYGEIKSSQKISGGPFTVDKVKLEDLQAGHLETSWTLGRRHPSVSDGDADQLADMLKAVLTGTLLSCAKGAWDVSDAFNQLLPEYRFVQIEEFLAAAWKGMA